MRKILYFFVLVLLCSLGYWGFQALFPSEREVVRARLTNLAGAVSVNAEEGTVTRMFRGSQLRSYFDPEVSLRVRGPDGEWRDIGGRDEILTYIRAIYASRSSIRVRFHDIQIQMIPGQRAAEAYLTVVAHVEDRETPYVQEAKVLLKKGQEGWRIHAIRSVETFEK